MIWREIDHGAALAKLLYRTGLKIVPCDERDREWMLRPKQSRRAIHCQPFVVNTYFPFASELELALDGFIELGSRARKESWDEEELDAKLIISIESFFDETHVGRMRKQYVLAQRMAERQKTAVTAARV